MITILQNISIWSVPIILLLIPVYGYFQGVKVYEVFTKGASEGVKTVFKIIPYLLAMLVAINIFKTSGAMAIFINIFKPIFNKAHVPDPVIPLIFLRPLSGSGSLSYVSDILKEFGADSLIGKMASTIQGSTETTFYIVAIYFGAVGIKEYRYSIIVGVLADITGFFAAVSICNLIF